MYGHLVALQIIDGAGAGGEVVATGPTPAGSAKPRQRRRYIARYRGENHEFGSVQALEAFVEGVQEREQEKPKRKRRAVQISLAPEWRDEVERIDTPIAEYLRIDVKPMQEALALARRFETALAERGKWQAEEEEIAAILLLMQ